jgi:hypothetical protein
MTPLKPTKCLGPGFPVFSDRIFLGKYKHPNSTTAIVSHYSFNQSGGANKSGCMEEGIMEL